MLIRSLSHPVRWLTGEGMEKQPRLLASQLFLKNSVFEVLLNGVLLTWKEIPANKKVISGSIHHPLKVGKCQKINWVLSVKIYATKILRMRQRWFIAYSMFSLLDIIRCPRDVRTHNSKVSLKICKLFVACILIFLPMKDNTVLLLSTNDMVC